MAAASLAIAMSVTSFGLGFLVGRDGPVVTPTVIAAPYVPDDALIELLARVEASSSAEGAVDVLTFPDALRGETGGVSVVPAPLPPSEAAVRIPPSPSVTPGDRPPAGQFTVVVGRGEDLTAMRALQAKLGTAGLSAWIGAEIVDGVAAWRVAVGGYPTEEAAAASLPIVRAAGLPGTVESTD